MAPISDDVTGDLSEQVTSETDLFNDALGMVGADPIRSVDDGTRSAKKCLNFYTKLRQGLLRSAKWNFAELRVELPVLATPPAFEYSYAFQLPAKCLRVWEYNGVGVTTTGYYIGDTTRYRPVYKIEGRTLVSNDSRALIVCTQDINNPEIWDPLFYQVVVTWMASKLAASIPKNIDLSTKLLSQATQILMPFALAADGQEGSTEPFIADSLTWGRSA